MNARSAAVIGAGPAGLMATEVLAAHGVQVDVYDAMPSAARKFLLAGIGGLNITHSEPADQFVSRYGVAAAHVKPWLADFDANALRAWVHDLGVETFVGSSGRVFPQEMKAAPLLRAWLKRLRASGVRLHARHRFTGWGAQGALQFDTAEGARTAQADITVLALGGASWSKLGSDGAWVPWLTARGVDVIPLAPSNCGFEAAWSAHLREKFAGEPVKAVTVRCVDASGAEHVRRGEFIITQHGVEGSAVYALSAPLRGAIAAHGHAVLHIDLLPHRTQEQVTAEIAHPRGARSMASHLASRLNLKGVKAALLRECASKEAYADPARLAAYIKALPITLHAPRPIDEAISTAGGVAFASLDQNLMLRALPGVFCAGEMLDWEAPTGGYLLHACLASGRGAGLGAARWLSLRGETKETTAKCVVPAQAGTTATTGLRSGSKQCACWPEI